MGVVGVKRLMQCLLFLLKGRIKRYLDMFRIDSSRHLDHEAISI